MEIEGTLVGAIIRLGRELSVFRISMLNEAASTLAFLEACWTGVKKLRLTAKWICHDLRYTSNRCIRVTGSARKGLVIEHENMCKHSAHASAVHFDFAIFFA